MLIVSKSREKENGFSLKTYFTIFPHSVHTTASSILYKRRGAIPLPCMLQTVSHVLFPCGRQPFIYTFLCPASASYSHPPAPLPNLGFSLVGFTRSTLHVSMQARLCGTFTASLPSLSPQASTQPSGRNLPGFIVSSSTNTTIITDRASMDFPLT